MSNTGTRLGPLLLLTLCAAHLLYSDSTKADEAAARECTLRAANILWNERDYKRAMVCFRKLRRSSSIDDADRYRALIGIGTTYYQQARNQNKASKTLQKATQALEEASLYFKDRPGGTSDYARAGIFLGLSKMLLEDYESAIQAFSALQPLTLSQGYRHSLATNLALSFNELGEYEKSLFTYRKRLDELKPQEVSAIRVANLKRNIGVLLKDMGQIEESYQEHLEANRIFARVENLDLRTRANIKHDIGYVLYRLGRLSEAEPYLDEALNYAVLSSDKSLMADVYDSLGQLHATLENYDQAMLFHSRSLALGEELGNLKRQRISLTNIGVMFEQQAKDDLAIYFYKRAVQVNERSRNEINKLRRKNKRYLERASDAYRRLTELLLKQERIYEALEISRLLKIQEVDEYLKVRTDSDKVKIRLSPEERKIQREYEDLKRRYDSREFKALRRADPATLTEDQQQRLQQLLNDHLALLRNFTEFIESEAVKNLEANRDGLSSIRLRDLRADIRELSELGDTALLHTLVFEDHLQLIYVLRNQPPKRTRIDVSKIEIATTVSQMLEYLSRPDNEDLSAARKLYDWVIAPLHEEFSNQGVKNIVYAPEGSLRYVPLSAFRSQNGWLVDEYASYRVTGVTRNKLDNNRTRDPRVFIGAYPDVTHNVEIDTEYVRFNGLKHAAAEATKVAELFPGSQLRHGDDFNYGSFALGMLDSNIIHMATHAKFVSSDPEKSVIVFGDGSAIRLRDVEDQIDLSNTDMVILSACETGVSGTGNGSEILSFGTVMGAVGASATLASLWTVSDESTAELMKLFYLKYKEGSRKAEALKHAQIAMANSQLPTGLSGNYSHPFYWAAFFIIGNGL